MTTKTITGLQDGHAACLPCSAAAMTSNCEDRTPLPPDKFVSLLAPTHTNMDKTRQDTRTRTRTHSRPRTRTHTYTRTYLRLSHAYIHTYSPQTHTLWHNPATAVDNETSNSAVPNNAQRNSKGFCLLILRPLLASSTPSLVISCGP